MSEKDQSKIEEIGMKEMNEASGGVESSILGGILDLFGKLFGGGKKKNEKNPKK